MSDEVGMDKIIAVGLLGTALVLMILAIVFVGWSIIVWVFSWVFGFEFMWRYVVGVWLGTIILRRIFGGNK